MNAIKPQYKKIFKTLMIILIITTAYLIAIGIQTTRYQKHGFNCVNMTCEARDFWETLGFTTKPMTGINKDGTKHVWLRIDITKDLSLHWESCHLCFMNPYDYYTNITQARWW